MVRSQVISDAKIGAKCEIKYVIGCPMCRSKIEMISTDKDQFEGYCDNCERKISLIDSRQLRGDGSILITLR